jgi:ribosome-associated toxin RatA of RatAB toxin-antitoxin module
MHRFILTSRWRLGPASPDRVWQLLTEVERWPRWWRHVRRSQVMRHGAANHVGDMAAIDLRSALLYAVHVRVTTTLADPMRQLEGRTEGDLHGHGTWLIEPAGEAVDVTYRLDVALHRPWMRALSFLLRPLFEWNHFAVMRGGARGKARALGAPLWPQHEWSGTARS